MIKIKTYKVFSTLLLYPDNDFYNNIECVIDILKDEKLLSLEKIIEMDLFVSHVKKNELLFLQESYVSIFDRQKHFSLYLFEHIHGDSRERGMAMVDLGNLYKKSNFEMLTSGELPDYIPVFLEYLSLLSKDKSSMLLGEIVNILAILRTRLKMINSPYYIIFFLLEFLSKNKPDEMVIKKIIANDKVSKLSNVELDKNWTEPKIF